VHKELVFSHSKLRESSKLSRMTCNQLVILVEQKKGTNMDHSPHLSLLGLFMNVARKIACSNTAML
jgi:hypothetical protein